MGSQAIVHSSGNAYGLLFHHIIISPSRSLFSFVLCITIHSKVLPIYTFIFASYVATASELRYSRTIKLFRIFLFHIFLGKMVEKNLPVVRTCASQQQVEFDRDVANCTLKFNTKSFE